MENRVAPQGKKPYEKPQLHRVRLAPEVATLGACKVPLGSGPINIDCLINTCASLSTS